MRTTRSGRPTRRPGTDATRLTHVEVQDCEHLRWFAGRVRAGEQVVCEDCQADRIVTRAVPQRSASRPKPYRSM